MKGNVRYVGFAFLGALLALTSCRDLALNPVFYTLSQEQPLGDDRGFPDTSSVFKMVRVTITTPAGEYYVAAAGKLYIRGTGPTDTWTVVDPPAGLANAMCNTLEVLGTQIYAGFINGGPSLSDYGLYSASLATLPLAWAPVSAFQDIQIALLKNVGGQLFVATYTGSVNALYYGDGTTFTAVTWATAPAADLSFTDVAQASADSSYWVLVGGYLYQSAALPGDFALYTVGAGSPPVSPLSPFDSPTSGGLFDDGTLYVAGGNGYLYSTANGGTDWVKSAQMLDDKKDPIHFTSSFVLPASDAGAVYVGTQGQGYRRVPGGDVTGGAGDLTREPTSYSITALYNGAINFLFYDAPSLFVCTNRSGLWRGDSAGGSVWTWKQE
jgi:hypothetical protein